MITYKNETNIDKKIIHSLCILKGYELIDYDRTILINDSGIEIECFILNKVNSDIFDFKTSEISLMKFYKNGYVLT